MNQLIKAGVDVNFFDTQDLQNTPLHWVASFADVDTVECLCGKILGELGTFAGESILPFPFLPPFSIWESVLLGKNLC